MQQELQSNKRKALCCAVITAKDEKVTGDIQTRNSQQTWATALS
jgi:hypothetical protein